MAGDAAMLGTAAHTLLEDCLRDGVDADTRLGDLIPVTTDGDHSAIGASSSNRWMNCAGSVALAATLPPEGVKSKSFPVDEKMVDGVQIALDRVRKWLANLDGSELHIETKVDLGHGLYGRNDIWIHQPFGTNIIADYKNGVNYVEVENNTQLMYYAAGVLKRAEMPAGRVILAIIQPNCIGHDAIRTWSTTVEHILDWEWQTLRPAARATEVPDAPLNRGSWCKKNYCPAISICPKFKQLANKTAQAVFGSGGAKRLPDPDHMSPEEIGKMLDIGEQLAHYFKEVKNHAHSLSRTGTKVPGWKRVNGKKTRSWVDPTAAGKVLAGAAPGIELYEEPRFKSVAQVEKTLTKMKVKPADMDKILGGLVKESRGEKFVSEEEAGVELPPPAVQAFAPAGK